MHTMTTMHAFSRDQGERTDWQKARPMWLAENWPPDLRLRIGYEF